MVVRLAACCLVIVLVSGCTRLGGSAPKSEPNESSGNPAAQSPASKLAAAKGQRPQGNTGPAVDSTAADLEQQVQAVFNKYCIRCHGRSGGLNLRQGRSFKNLVGVASKGYKPKLRVVPGKPEQSVLYHKLMGSKGYGRRMPRGGKLPDEKIALIKKWIESLGQRQ